MANAGRAWDVRIEREDGGPAVILSISGRVGHGEAGRLAAALLEARAGRRPLVIDLTGVEYLSGPGLDAIRAAMASERGSPPAVLCGLQGPVRVAFDLAGGLEDWAWEADRTAAVARVLRW